ncbi:hypothetical protein CYMTET_46294, partial [Cymbomonas tetramitiformis]
GALAAEHAAKHLHGHLAQALPSSYYPLTAEQMNAAFRTAFHTTDDEIIQFTEQRRLTDGCTAIAAVITGGSIYVANLGDCRAVLCRSGQAKRLSDDHKPNRADERARVEKAGGEVVLEGPVWRVATQEGTKWLKKAKMGDVDASSRPPTMLAVSRAFGDVKLKRPLPLVSATPEIEVCKLDDEDAFMVLACDGVWDVLTEQEAVDVVIGHRITDDASGAKKALLKAAFDRGSTDNLTAIVIFFGKAEDVSSISVHELESPLGIAELFISRHHATRQK